VRGGVLMRPIVLAVVFAASAVALVPAPGKAQPRSPTLALDCRAERVRSLSEEEIRPGWLAAHPDHLRGRIEPLTSAGAWSAALDTVLGRSRENLRFVDSTARARYEREFAETRRTFNKLLQLKNEAQPRFMADSVRPVRWELSQNPTTGAFRVFAGTDQIVVTDSMSSDERRALCWPAISISAFLNNYQAPVRDATVEALNSLAVRWDRYIDNSYSQLPWELFVNGLGRSRRDWEPPRRQWILVHPSVGVELAGLSWSNLVRVNVAAVEPVGIIRYSSDYKRYYGISTVATFATDRSAAVGGYLHLWYPQAKVGYVVRSDPDPKRRQSVLVTVDLYDLLTGVPKDLSEAKETALGLRKAQPSKP
jgi:hypothetical protein